MFFTVVSCSLALQAAETEVSTEYKGGEFVTTVNLPVYASDEKIHFVLDKFISEYNDDLAGLFKWALTGLKIHGEPDDFIMFDLKSHIFDKQSKVIDGIMDINVAFLQRDYADVAYKTTLKKEKRSDYDIFVQYEMLECEKVISHVDAEFRINRIDESYVECIFFVKVKLQRPFNLMTKKQYRENIEWRFAKFMENIKREAEQK